VQVSVFSVAVKGYGIVLWEDGQWRTFSASESLSAILAARVENALKPIAYGYEEDVRDALLAMSGASLLAEHCDHGPGCCEDGGLSLS
jgi:predicted Zn-dependent protease